MMTKLRSAQAGGDQRGLSAMTKRLKPVLMAQDYFQSLSLLTWLNVHLIYIK